MTSYEILVKCGYSPEEASRISGMPIPKPKPLTREEIADMNEAKYGGQLTWEDRLMENYPGATLDRICANQPDTGDCTTRRGVYRRLKFGKGNLGHKGWLEQGFDENRRSAK